jgi:hypothetical protein
LDELPKLKHKHQSQTLGRDWQTGITKIITEGGLCIENTIVKQVASLQPQQPQYFKKRIGATYYKVAIYKSNTSTENIEDKILHLAKNDATNIAIATSAKGAVNQ